MVGGGYKFLQKDFEKSSEKFSRLIGRNFFLTLLAPIFIESFVIAIAILILVVVFVFSGEKNNILNEIFPLISVFARGGR